MTRYYFIFLMAIVIKAPEACAQLGTGYFEQVDLAIDASRQKDFAAAGAYYEEAFKILGNQSWELDRYNAACVFALAENKPEAFKQLYYLAKQKKYRNPKQLLSDSDFNYLHDSRKWSKLIKRVNKNKQSFESKLDLPLANLLDSIYHNDQDPIDSVQVLRKKYGLEAPQVKAMDKIIHQKNKENLVVVEQILAEHGWLGADEVGDKGNSALWLVIQHADLDTQVKYLPMMQKARAEGKALPRNVAYLEDRVASKLGKKQIYGSQIKFNPATKSIYVWPIEDPANVDKRRATVGLRPIAPHIKRRFGLIWDLEAHLEIIATFEAEQAKQND